MPVEKIDIENFLFLAETFPVLDVRSPAEYAHAHIPGSFPVPLFTDEQRKIIGTAYKKESRQAAVNHGLNYFSERMKIIPVEVENMAKTANNEDNSNKTFLVHCWRGGMRSDAVAWLLNLYGYKIYLLKGGYKAFRRWALAQFEKKFTLKVVGGFTGSGKTKVLKELSNRGRNVIDLEGLANHKGSAFGALGEQSQPSSEMFENLLAVQLRRVSRQESGNADTQKEIWVEDESGHIGTVGIPKAFWSQMRESPLYFLNIPFEERLKDIVKTYGVFNREDLIECVLKIQKRLGGLQTKEAIRLISEGDLDEAFCILLKYYDKMYEISLHKRENVDALLHKVECQNVDAENAGLLIAG